MNRPLELSRDAVAALSRVSTATLSTQLLRRGYRNIFVGGLVSTRPELRLLGYAFTLRYVPAREDVAVKGAPDNRTNVQRVAVEAVGPGDVLVIDARGDLSAGVLGNILASRLARRGAAGIVTDGCFRDSAGFRDVDMPCYHREPNAGVSWLAHHAADMNVPIGCGGVLVVPGDVVVGDEDGVIVIPSQIAEEVALGAAEQELIEAFALERVAAGEAILDLYPLSDSRRQEFDAWLAKRGA